jgi:hypothetical protein
LNQCRMVVCRRAFVRARQAVSLIQSQFRGHVIRSSPIGAAIRKITELQRDVYSLELLLLRIR